MDEDVGDAVVDVQQSICVSFHSISNGVLRYMDEKVKAWVTLTRSH